jgi:hypothetical protein
VTYLYKYLPPERIDVLETQMIRLTQPGDLNDPAESQARFRGTRVAWDKFVEDASGLFPKLKLKEGDFKDFLNWLRPSQRPIVQRKILQGILDLGTGIISLSASRNVEAMWSHYADSHRGLVIGFDKASRYFSTGNGKMLAQVKYEKHLRSFACLEDMDARSVFFTKSSSWAYEREWRLVKSLALTERFISSNCPKTESGYDLWLEQVPASVFRSVAIGFRMPEVLRLRVMKALSKPGFRHVEAYEAKLGTSGRLHFRRL